MSAELLLRRREMMKSAAAAVDPYLLQPFTITILSGSGNFFINDYYWGMVESPLTSLFVNKNDTGWVEWTWDDSTGSYLQTLNVTQGDTIQIKAVGAWGINASEFLEMNSNYDSVRCALSGNINSLVHGDNFVSATSMPTRALYKIFGSVTNGFTFQDWITDISNLRMPATQLSTSCYEGLFYYKRNLVGTLPELPATTLASACYRSMYRYCVNITTAPVLPATQLVSNCYNTMFNYCSKLNYVKAMFIDAPVNTNTLNGQTANWLQGVASSGTFVKNSLATWTTSGNNGVPSGWTIQYASS